MKSGNTAVLLSVFLWVIVVGTGLLFLAKYEVTPGPAAQTDAGVASMQAIMPSPGKMTLVMFVHPKCPCSEASLEELSQLMASYGNRLNASVLMYQPSRQADDWATSTEWRTAMDVPGLAVHSDVDAMIARKYRAQTSGQTFLYDEEGRLVFEGGITASRGHVGDNDGLQAVISLVSKGASADSPCAFAPIFGCPIYGCSRCSAESSLASVIK
jgi:hypothetical protein